MPRPKPYFSKSEVITALHKICELLNEGDSINVAKKKVCGGSQNKWAKQISQHPLYLHILNDYMITRNYNRSFYATIMGLKQGPLRVPELLKEYQHEKQK
jgi:hypothetical protein